MPKRRRAATRVELVEFLAGRDGSEFAEQWTAILQELDDAGVRLELEIVVHEEV